MILSMFLQDKKAGYLSVEEFATLVNVHSFIPLGDTKEEITETLEIFISGERGLGTEFNEHEQADVKTLIKKISTLDDKQITQLAEAFEQAEKLWGIFTFVNPIERLDIEEKKTDGLEKICKDSVNIAKDSMKIVQDIRDDISNKKNKAIDKYCSVSESLEESLKEMQLKDSDEEK